MKLLPSKPTAAMIAAAPDVQGEPVGWVSSLTDRHPRFVTDLNLRSIAEVKEGVQYFPVYAAPQPAEQQDNVPDGWRHRFLKLMGEIQSELDDSNDDPIPSELWSLWRELLDAAQQPAEQPTISAYACTVPDEVKA